MGAPAAGSPHELAAGAGQLLQSEIPDHLRQTGRPGLETLPPEAFSLAAQSEVCDPYPLIVAVPSRLSKNGALLCKIIFKLNTYSL